MSPKQSFLYSLATCLGPLTTALERQVSEYLDYYTEKIEAANIEKIKELRNELKELRRVK